MRGSRYQVGRPERGRERKWCVPGALHPLYASVAHAWRIDRNRRGEFPMWRWRVGLYLIHSPRSSSDPSWRLFHRGRGIEHDSYGEEVGRVEENTPRNAIHAPPRGNRCPVSRDPNRSHRCVSMQLVHSAYVTSGTRHFSDNRVLRAMAARRQQN